MMHRRQVKRFRSAGDSDPSVDEYRTQHAALEAALDILDRFLDSDPDGDVRRQVESALKILLRRIGPILDELDDDG